MKTLPKLITALALATFAALLAVGCLASQRTAGDNSDQSINALRAQLTAKEQENNVLKAQLEASQEIKQGDESINAQALAQAVFDHPEFSALKVAVNKNAGRDINEPWTGRIQSIGAILLGALWMFGNRFGFFRKIRHGKHYNGGTGGGILTKH